jgi:hypothetical protein
MNVSLCNDAILPARIVQCRSRCGYDYKLRAGKELAYIVAQSRNALGKTEEIHKSSQSEEPEEIRTRYSFIFIS